MSRRNRLQTSNTATSIGALCMALGILAPWLFHPASGLLRNALEAAGGALLGVSIVLNLWGARLARRSRCGEAR